MSRIWEFLRLLSKILRHWFNTFKGDFMVLTDGILYLVEGVVEIFEEFNKISGLKISTENQQCILWKSPKYSTRDMKAFHFNYGNISVQFLGLLHVRQSHDYCPLLEKLGSQIGSWTNEFLICREIKPFSYDTLEYYKFLDGAISTPTRMH